MAARSLPGAVTTRSGESKTRELEGEVVLYFGPVEPSLHAMFGDSSEAAARRSVELFAAEVAPRLTDLASDPQNWGKSEEKQSYDI